MSELGVSEQVNTKGLEQSASVLKDQLLSSVRAHTHSLFSHKHFWFSHQSCVSQLTRLTRASLLIASALVPSSSYSQPRLKPRLTFQPQLRAYERVQAEGITHQ